MLLKWINVRKMTWEAIHDGWGQAVSDTHPPSSGTPGVTEVRWGGGPWKTQPGLARGKEAIPGAQGSQENPGGRTEASLPRASCGRRWPC